MAIHATPDDDLDTLEVQDQEDELEEEEALLPVAETDAEAVVQVDLVHEEELAKEIDKVAVEEEAPKAKPHMVSFDLITRPLDINKDLFDDGSL